jgi:hypothetical protein
MIISISEYAGIAMSRYRELPALMANTVFKLNLERESNPYTALENYKSALRTTEKVMKAIYSLESAMRQLQYEIDTAITIEENGTQPSTQEPI